MPAQLKFLVPSPTSDDSDNSFLLFNLFGMTQKLTLDQISALWLEWVEEHPEWEAEFMKQFPELVNDIQDQVTSLTE